MTEAEKIDTSDEECALICMIVSNPQGAMQKTGWQKRVNDLIRALRDERNELADLILAIPLPDGASEGRGEEETWVIEHDGFVGVEIGRYTTREGKEGVVLQQVGTRVVHVYARKWLVPSPPPAEGG